MSHRRIASLAVLGVLFAAARGTPAGASATKTVGFRLTNTTAAAVSEMYFDLVPRGVIVPPIIGADPDGRPLEGSPMTALPSSTGIDVSTAYVLLTDEPSDPDVERMFLLFGHEPDADAALGGGLPFRPLLDGEGARVGRLDPGGTFDFELNLAQDAVAWLLRPGIDGLALSLLDVESPAPPPAPGPGTDPDPVPGTPIPEPSALLLWAAIGAGALGLARRRRAASAPALS